MNYEEGIESYDGKELKGVKSESKSGSEYCMTFKSAKKPSPLETLDEG